MLELPARQRTLRRRLVRLAIIAVLVTICPDAIPVRATTPQAPVGYADAASGFAIEAPSGWRRIRDDEMALPRGAKAGFLDASSTVFVYVLIDFIPGGLIPRNDGALASYLAMSGSTTNGGNVLKEPVPASLAGRRAVRRSVNITSGQNALVKTLTVARDGYYYFVITSIAVARDERRQEASHLEFERGVTISKTSDDVVDAIAAPFGDSMPYLNAEDLRSLMYAMIDRSKSVDGVEATTLGYTVSVSGRERLSTADRETLDALQTKALATLPAADGVFLERVRADVEAGRPVSSEDSKRIGQLQRRAFNALSATELVAVRTLALESLRLGLEAYDSRPLPSPPSPPSPSDTEVIRGVPGGVPDGVPGGNPGGMPPPPPAGETPKTDRPRIQRVSGGVLAGKATRKPQPNHPEMARAAGIDGAVVVEVTVSEAGEVISARAVSGHPLLRDAAVQAARGWAFHPTKIQGYPVKVIGTITFIFRRGLPPVP